MTCIPFKQGNMTGFFCIADLYRYKGFTFEFGYCGPMKCRADGEPAKREGRKFYRVVTEWLALTEEEKRRTRV